MKDLTPLAHSPSMTRSHHALVKMFRDISTPIFFRLLWSVLRPHEVRRPIDPVRR